MAPLLELQQHIHLGRYKYHAEFCGGGMEGGCSPVHGLQLIPTGRPEKLEFQALD